MKISLVDPVLPTSFRPFGLSIQIENESDLKSLRAFFGGLSDRDVNVAIANSATPYVGCAAAGKFVLDVSRFLNDACEERGIETMETS